MSTAMPAAGSTQDVQRMMLYDANKKSTGLAYVLWFFFGMFGGHRFYVGKTGSAIAMLAISAVSFLLMAVFIGFITIWITGIWVLVDAFMIPGWISAHNNRLISGLNA